MSEKLDEYIHDCMTNKIIDIYSFFSERQLKLLEKIDLKIENVKYTINEFDKIQSKLLEIYHSKALQDKKGITKETCSDLLDILYKVASKYNI